MINRDLCFDENSLFGDLEDGTGNLPLFPFEIEENDIPNQNASQTSNVSFSPTSSSENSSQSPRRMRSLRDIYDLTEEVEHDAVFFVFFVGEDPISFDDASKQEKWSHERRN